MKRIRKFFLLPSRHQWFLVKSLFLVGVIRLGLWMLPFSILRRLLAMVVIANPESRGRYSASMDQVAWAVTVVSRYIPEATCLTQALATQILLRRRGYWTHLRIGVARSDTRKLEAHAWVESEGRIVIGGLRDLSRHTPLPPLTGKGL